MSGAEEGKAESRGASRDMSPQAISRRFDILVELDRIAREFRAAGRLAKQPAKKQEHN